VVGREGARGEEGVGKGRGGVGERTSWRAGREIRVRGGGDGGEEEEVCEED